MFGQRAVRSTAFWIVAVLTLTAQVIVAAIAIRLTTTTLSSHATQHMYSFGLAASILDLCSMAFLLCSVAARRSHGCGIPLIAFYATAAPLGTCAALLSIVLFANLRQSATGALSRARMQEQTALAVAGIAFVVVLLFAHTALYTYLLWPQKRKVQAVSEDAFEDERLSTSRSMERSLSVSLTYLKPTAPPIARAASEPYSPTPSTFSTSPRSSWRASLNHAIRPMTSKTRLIRSSFISSQYAHSYHSGRPLSFDAPRPTDGFELWDTSAVEEGLESSYTPTQANAQTIQPEIKSMRLETIPGSRPVSPARPLDGPFSDLDPVEPGETPLLDSPICSPSIETSSIKSEKQSIPPLLRRSSTQQHIHPLFRPESPMPPPLPSPGTVITASPLAGQVVSPAYAAGWTLHSKEVWRPGSTAPVSPSGSWTGSVRSLRLQSPTSLAGGDMPSSPLSGSVT